MSREASAGWAEIKETGFLRTHFTTRVWNLIQGGIGLYGVLSIFYLIIRWTAGESWPWVAFLNNFIPWYGILGGLLAIIALFSPLRLLLVALQAPMIAVFLTLYGGLLLPRSSIHKPAGTDLTLATFNLHSAQSDPEAIVQTIRKLNADIVGVEELDGPHAALFEKELADQYPYRLLLPSPAEHGVGLLSRYPIQDYSIFYPFHKYIRHIRAIVDIDGVPVVIYVTHPHSPSRLFTRYDDSMRRDEMAALRKSLQNETGPVLVMCDCNMTQASDDYRKLDNLLQDSFYEAGWGLGFTFPAKGFGTPRMVRIDYIWHNRAFVAYDAYVGSSSGTSDHRPVVARLVLKETSK